VHSALASYPPRIPLYCLYAHWSKKQCYKGVELPLNQAVSGCSIVSPVFVRDLWEYGKDHLHDLFPVMHPWHELVAVDFATNQFSEKIRDSALVILRQTMDHEPASRNTSLKKDFGVPYHRQQNKNLLKAIASIKPNRTAPSYVLETAHGGFSEIGRSDSLNNDPDLLGVTAFVQQ
jgi:hypothetical protein